MSDDVFAALFLPLLFGMGAGIYGFAQFPERREKLLLALVLLQLVGAVELRGQSSLPLTALLCLHALVVTSLMVQLLQAPATAQD